VAAVTLTVENGCFSYDGRHTVLSDISFCASPGEIVAILGKNGSGKTTLLKCSVGLLKWSGGHSFLDGRDVLHIKSRELWSKISYVSVTISVVLPHIHLPSSPRSNALSAILIA